MVNVTPTYLTGSAGKKTNQEVVTYTAMGASDTGIAFEKSNHKTKTVHVTGTFGGTVTIQGSNDPLGITTPGSAVWITLTTDGSAALTFTATGMENIHENPRFIRAITGSGVSDVDVIFNVIEK